MRARILLVIAAAALTVGVISSILGNRTAQATDPVALDGVVSSQEEG